MNHQVFIGLGSNLDNPLEQLRIALESLNALPDTRVEKVSSFYGSTPLGPEDQPDYVNAVAELCTTLQPSVLLDALQSIESTQGRVKKRHWGERLIDLDILLYDDLQMQSERLQIPHSQMAFRDFVLVPLHELDAGLSIPGVGSIQGLIDGLKTSYLKPLVKSNLSSDVTDF
ncbi:MULTISPECIES: 2-amino-4-hydroxy-6-hydroxymethyldihydropteridine diphosphokinase [Thiomicrorhabdus]|uniref:2-amino-4-hydroxy-6-hydroxymethyldihydropteridine pyrophosphokinase n=1 Tax=Thiomicrorhabdus heinhorstiae TaxID=2748010 RepID=A0ABS0BZ54_9GAMM|nr:MULTISPECIES: 2-amino-4-hydroxy-6-hydroxymethyldihydropteridine diphosphokinase [Thiomicrorhabdus]MBF6058719.1 2-amino-4-hydroxy-6-hydroxymethyldihydropteridine diphosphokinase [Thiomicrorhabdus heinhorstiae]